MLPKPCEGPSEVTDLAPCRLAMGPWGQLQPLPLGGAVLGLGGLKACLVLLICSHLQLNCFAVRGAGEGPSESYRDFNVL